MRLTAVCCIELMQSKEEKERRKKKKKEGHKHVKQVTGL
jgi:hypothetical protein